MMMKFDLYHYYERNQGPFKNLSALEIDEAEKILQKIRYNGDTFASKRSLDYIKIRKELENKAREAFIAKGGNPKKMYPHYMTLGECGWIKEWYRDGKEVKISLAEFKEDNISFTYGDLFPTMRYQDGKEYREQVYTKEEIMKLIEKYGLPQEWNKEGTYGPERYIEVQIWSNEVINKYV